MNPFPFGLPARYEYAGERMEGGSGYVYVCHDKFLDRKVAIKVLKTIGDGKQLQREWAALRDVWSQHIAEIYDLVFAKRSEMVGLVQEYVPGLSLESYALTEIANVDYVKTLWQLARGIGDIHACGKIHRDIKPSNVRFDSERVLKILDFGLSSDVSPDAETLAARGTLHYLGPEFYESPPIKYTTAADVYAFGVTAWYLATKGKLHAALKTKPPRSELLPSFSSVRGDLPQDLVDALDSTLKAALVSRPSIAEVREALARHLLFGRHRATFGHDGTITQLAVPGKAITVRREPDSMTVHYDGLLFRITQAKGDVYLNNARVHVQDVLRGSGVITLGHPTLGYQRTFITLDMAHPEVVP